MPCKSQMRTLEQRNKISIGLKKFYRSGSFASISARQRTNLALTGRSVSPETRKKLSDSNILAWKHRKGHPISLETRQKISRALMGHKVSDELKEKIRQKVLAVGMSEETKRKSREFNKAWKPTLEMRIKMGVKSKGPLNSRWKGGITPEVMKIRMSLATKIWREKVFVRDNFTCQRCLVRGGDLAAHHVQSFSQFPELRFDISNGQTLCKKCHRFIHSKNYLVEQTGALINPCKILGEGLFLQNLATNSASH